MKYSWLARLIGTEWPSLSAVDKRHKKNKDTLSLPTATAKEEQTEEVDYFCRIDREKKTF